MTISDNPNAVYELARRCFISALVLTDPTGEKFHVLTLGSGTEQTEKETALSIERGLTVQAGCVGLTREFTFESVAKMGFSSTILRASAVFLYSLIDEQKRTQREIAELERIVRLTGTGQA